MVQQADPGSGLRRKRILDPNYGACRSWTRITAHANPRSGFRYMQILDADYGASGSWIRIMVLHADPGSGLRRMQISITGEFLRHILTNKLFPLYV